MAFGSFPVITDARSAASQEQATRQRRYAITMAFRTACFIAMIFVPGGFRWVLFAGAVFLPYIAVIFANQAQQRPPGDAAGAAANPETLPPSPPARSAARSSAARSMTTRSRGDRVA